MSKSTIGPPRSYKVCDMVYDTKSNVSGRVSRINFERGTTSFKATSDGHVRTLPWSRVRRFVQRRPRYAKYEELPPPLQARVLKLSQAMKLCIKTIIRELELRHDGN